MRAPFIHQLTGVIVFPKEDLVMRSSMTVTRRQLVYLISIVQVLVLVGNASAAIMQWDGGGDSQLWSDPLNWLADTVPGSGDGVYIDIPDANCLIDSSVNAECATLYVSNDNAPCYLNMTGGTLTSGGRIRIGEPSDSNGFFVLSGGIVNTSNVGRLFVGYNGTGTLIITGGEMTVSDKIECGKNGGSTGYIYVHGGTLNVEGYGSDDFEIGKYGTGIVTITGGVIDVNDNIKLGEQSTGIGRLYLYGGTVNAGNIRDPDDGIYGDPLMDITEGKLILPGGYSTGEASIILDEYISNGWIIGYGGLGRVIVTYDSGADQTIVTAGLADPELAWNPNPSNFSTAQWSATGLTLSWSPGDYAVSHDVYFGTDKDDVNDADNTTGLWPEFKGNQDPCSYDTGPLDLGQTYYWRIDEVNDNAWAPPGSPWKGIVWSFTTADYIVVDDMESYGDANTPGEPGSRIWYVWKDGQGWTNPSVVEGNGTGSTVGNWPPPIAETGTVHEGAQSLPYSYDNSGEGDKAFYSEAERTFDPPQDWTEAGVKALELWFYGDPNNDANATEQMYVKLNSAAKVPYDGDMADIKEQEWHQWLIDLAEFGIDLTNVNSITIGFGDEATTTPAGSGKVYFDDIRLYIPRCIPSRRQPAADLDDDCDVDYDDLNTMSEDWLESDYGAVGNDGVLNNFPNDNSQWVNDLVRGRSLRFDGVDDWVDLNDSDFSNFHDKTISLWVNIREFPEDSIPYIFCFRDDDDEPHPYRIYFRLHGQDNVRMQFVGSAAEDYSEDFDGAYPNTWHHLAFVLRDTGSDTCTGEFYGDGTLIDEMPDRPRHSGGARSVNLGSWNAGNAPFVAASMDDFRVYDAALSADNIKYLAEVPGGVAPTADMMLHYRFDEVSGHTAKNSSTYVFNRPLLSAAELYAAEAPGSRAVNFRDFAVLAEMWLDEQLWP